MRKPLTILTSLVTLLFSAILYGQNNKAVTDYLRVPGPIVFERKPYNLTWTSHPATNFYKQEYIAAGDIVTKFKTMILIDFVTGSNIKDVVGAKIDELKKLKEANPMVNYEILENPKNGEYMLDFLLSQNAPDGKSMAVVERNVYRYKIATDKSGQKGVLLFGVSTRSYGNDIDKFLASLKSNRNQLITNVSQFNIPEISITK